MKKKPLFIEFWGYYSDWLILGYSLGPAVSNKYS